MKVRKAVIPAAGFGTRMLPITSVVPKELLPICGKPVIHYVVQEAVDAGINEIILILSKGKEAVAEYFRPNKRLADQLLKKGNTSELQTLEKIWDMAKITVVYQDEQKGLGDAVLCAAQSVENEPFTLLLGDSIIRTDDCNSFTSELISAFGKYDRSIVGVKEVEECLVSRYGIFEGSEFEDGIYTAEQLLEKPDQSATDSSLAFCARYVFKPEIFNYLGNIEPGVNNEIQLTD
ncbi:MAG: NTP transferase domain-containing protein, partial [Flavobacteriales bacterium]|nr:NTP transferase domain-containing protein [Flavobacteriales bacterium]